MIEIKIPKEVRTYKEKFLFGLTFRQTICSAAAILINVPLYFFLSKQIGQDAAGWAVIVVAAPLALVGFIKYNGMHFEQLAKCILQFEFNLQKRPYKIENLYQWLAQEGKEQKDESEFRKNEGTTKKTRANKKERGSGKEKGSQDSAADNSLFAEL